MKRWVRRGASFLCLFMVALTALALIETDEWWIRVLDFPRPQFASVLAAALLVLWASSFRARFPTLVSAASVAALIWQIWLIVPYTPLWPAQMVAATGCDRDRRVRFLLANVRQDNRNAEPLLALARDLDPDVILLTEIDPWWEQAVSTLRDSHPETVLKPLSNTYGIGLYSRLPLRGAEIRYLLKDYVPSIRTRVALADGTDFSMWAVHPAPPRPGDDTDERDAELLLVAKEVEDTDRPAVVGGDLNDVAWSSTTTLFQEVSGLLDPRIGRALYATFNAEWPLLKWPLDHLFASREWMLGEFRRLDDIGSDHFPILVELCHQPEAAAIQDGNAPEPGDGRDAQDHIDEGREAARED